MQIINNTFLGRCSNCGKCCSDFLHLDNDEINKIDNYLKEHKIYQANKGENNFRCPFRDDFLKRCNIYEVRPYICRIFKCDTPPEKTVIIRDEINKDKKPRSMAELFFKDESKIEYLNKNFKIKVFKRKE